MLSEGLKYNSKFIRINFGIFHQVVAVHPDSVKYVLKNPQIFTKKEVPMPKKVEQIVKNNILSENGEAWRLV